MRPLSRRQGWRFALAAVALVVVANVAMVTWLLPEGDPQPLSLGTTELRWTGDEAAISAPVHNDGDRAVELVSASAPGVPGATVRRPVDGTYTTAADAWTPVAGRTVPAGGDEWLDIAVPARCPHAPTVKGLEVRMRIDGRDVTQALTLPKLAPVRCR
ncbi:hypothetical protein C8N24_0095 [Solirubrobacter pauli]|uniref:Uncharacterized protein n=1 Tax=Solirubrobacter pauli TaxID=166793 RepID=A0A660L7R1_9ACTN|nr:hypothetical protein C8N24_0095 [Solirubrobacter pauli]